jgi:replicative DNA helicase
MTLGTLAAAAGGRVEVEPRPGWREPVNLYAAPTLPPGARKSAVVTEITRPLEAFERAEAECSRLLIVEAAATKRAAERRAEQAQAAAGKAAEEAPACVAEAIRLVQEADAITVPPEPRLLVDDATPEALRACSPITAVSPC